MDTDEFGTGERWGVIDATGIARSDQRSDRYPRGALLIYFMGTEDERLVKIGKTTQRVGARRAQHERRGPHDEPMHFLAGVLGTSKDENVLRSYFGHLAIPNRKEWLRAESPIVDYIRWLLGQPFVASCEEECERLALMPNSYWHPTSDRRTSIESMQLPLTYGPWSSLARGRVLPEKDYYTPPAIIECAREVMGGIDLDPATHRIANQIVRANHIYTADDNGLALPWHGRVWLNPPFAAWDEWTPKALAEWNAGHVTEICLLATTRTLTAKGFSAVFDVASGLCIPFGRLPFWGPLASVPNDGHAIVYVGSQFGRFAEIFRSIGHVFALAERYRPPSIGAQA